METLKSPDVLRRTGATYRQLDTWTTAGFISTDGDCNPGSGYRREWPMDEVRVIERMVRVVRAGMSVRQAAQVARQSGEIEIAPGVFVRVEDGP